MVALRIKKTLSYLPTGNFIFSSSQRPYFITSTIATIVTMARDIDKMPEVDFKNLEIEGTFVFIKTLKKGSCLTPLFLSSISEIWRANLWTFDTVLATGLDM